MSTEEMDVSSCSIRACSALTAASARFRSVMSRTITVSIAMPATSTFESEASAGNSEPSRRP